MEHAKDGTFSDAYDEASAAKLYKAEEAWRMFLLGESPHPGAFRQHLLPFPGAMQWGPDWPPNMNRYTLRTTQIDICGGEGKLYTYVKIPRFMVFGHIEEVDPGSWVDTKVNANSGTIGSKQYQLPIGLVGYIRSRAQSTIDAMSNISDRQNDRIQSSIIANASDIAGSDFFDAMNADLKEFGAAAFIGPR